MTTLTEFEAFSRQAGVNYLRLYFVDGMPTNKTIQIANSGHLRTPISSVLDAKEDYNFEQSDSWELEDNVLPMISPPDVIDIHESFPEKNWKASCDSCAKIKKVSQLIPCRESGVGGIKYESRELFCEACAYEDMIEELVSELSYFAQENFRHFDALLGRSEEFWREWFNRIITKPVFSFLWQDYTDSIDFFTGRARTPIQGFREGDFFPVDITYDILQGIFLDVTDPCGWQDASTEEDFCLERVLPEKVYVDSRQKMPTLVTVQSTENIQFSVYGDRVCSCDNCKERHKNDWNKNQKIFSFFEEVK